MVLIDRTQLLRIPCINIMEMNSGSRLREFCISLRPLTGGFQILFEALLSILVRNIKVDHDVMDWHLHIMKTMRINIFQCYSNI